MASPLPHARHIRPVEVHDLRAAQLDVHRNEEGGRSLIVPLALPPLLRKHHGVGGQALRHIGDQRDRVVAELRHGVCGHREVVPGPLLAPGGVEAFQGTPHLGTRGRGVSAVPEPGECTREMLSCSP